MIAELAIELAMDDTTKDDAVKYAARSMGNILERLMLSPEAIELLDNDLQTNVIPFYTLTKSKNDAIRRAKRKAKKTDDDEFNFDLDKMKAAVESGRVSIPKEALTSFEAFDKWLSEDTEPVIKKVCDQKVNGSCPLHNLHCQYPECEK
jgi:hypothetical protein